MTSSGVPLSELLNLARQTLCGVVTGGKEVEEQDKGVAGEVKSKR